MSLTVTAAVVQCLGGWKNRDWADQGQTTFFVVQHWYCSYEYPHCKLVSPKDIPLAEFERAVKYEASWWSGIRHLLLLLVLHFGVHWSPHSTYTEPRVVLVLTPLWYRTHVGNKMHVSCCHIIFYLLSTVTGTFGQR